MQLGVVGLGRMGGNIARRLMRNGHQCDVRRAADLLTGSNREDGFARAVDRYVLGREHVARPGAR